MIQQAFLQAVLTFKAGKVSCRHRNTEKKRFGESLTNYCQGGDRCHQHEYNTHSETLYEDDMLLLIKLAQYSLVYWSGGIPLFQYHFGSPGFF
jgi:hypothetical protein